MYRIVLTVILCMGSLFLGAQWQWVNPVPQGNVLKDICMTPSGNIVAVGSSKTIIISKDHGISWQVINVGNDPKTYLTSVFFTDDSLGWITGYKYFHSDLYKNFILKTSDCGMTWDTAYYAVDRKLMSIFFINKMKGWAVGEGGKMIRTTDGGNSWELMSAGCDNNLKSVCFADENIGIAVGENGTVLFTEKGGQQWEKIAIDINSDLNRVFLLNWHCMYAVGLDGLVLFSDDGRQWQSRSIEIDRHLYDVHFNNPDTGWVCGYTKNVYMTTDGGLSWNPQWVGGSGDYPEYLAMCCDGDKELWTVGWYGNIVGTFDGGDYWNHINPGMRSDLRRISFLDESVGWLMDNDEIIYKTSDGGNSWVPMTTAENYLWDLFCLDEEHIYACGVQLIMSTSDGGTTWSSYTFPSNDVDLERIFFTDPLHGWAVGMYDTVYITHDGGTKWNAVPLPIYAYNNFALFFADQNNGWIGGDNILHTTDGGLTWENQYQGGLTTYDIYFSDLLTGWFIEADGYIFHTTDGGENWDLQLSNAYYIFDMSFTDAMNGWVLGYEGIIWRTQDGGNSWNKSYLPTQNAFRSVSAIDDNHVWISGLHGAILRYFGDEAIHRIADENVLPVTGIEINESENEFQIIPENDALIMTSAIFRVFNLQGSIVYQSTKLDNFNLNYYSYLANLKLCAGIYIIQVVKESGVETKKVLID